MNAWRQLRECMLHQPQAAGSLDYHWFEADAAKPAGVIERTHDLWSVDTLGWNDTLTRRVALITVKVTE